MEEQSEMFFKELKKGVSLMYKEYQGSDTSFIDNVFDLKVEIMGVMLAIELVVVKGWLSIWLEMDSMLMVEAFKKPARRRWNCS